MCVALHHVSSPQYARCLGAVYLRLIGRPREVYEYLEPLYNDYRKLRLMTSEGKYVLTHVDEFVDSLLNSDSVCGTLALPRLPKRWELEKSSGVRKSFCHSPKIIRRAHSCLYACMRTVHLVHHRLTLRSLCVCVCVCVCACVRVCTCLE